MSEQHCIDLKVKLMQHPIYGEYHTGWRKIPKFPNYEIDEYCNVRNASTKRTIKPAANFQVLLHRSNNFGGDSAADCEKLTNYKKRRFAYRVYHLGLMAFFPHIEPQETVDHIDECRTNHHIANLQWLSNRENAIKSNQLRPRKRKIDDSHRYIQQRHLTSGAILCEFTPTELRNQKFSLHAVKKCMAGETDQYSNFCWTKKLKSNDDLPGEEWKTSAALRNRLSKKRPGGTPISKQTINRILVSNRGRILLANGTKTFGVKLQYSVYRRAYSVKMHILVWDVWGSRERLPNECILHDDSQPHDFEGCVYNDIRFLRLGTQRENMLEWHSQKRLRSTPDGNLQTTQIATQITPATIL